MHKDYDTGIWPEGYHGVYYGFDDDYLELMCSDSVKEFDKSLSIKNTIWLYWTTEVYSFGKCYRDWLNLPWWLPLPIYGDHAVSLYRHLTKHERESKPLHYFAWNKQKKTNSYSKKKVIHIQHPWITYRLKYGITQKSNAKGTIVFLAHKTNNIDLIDYDYDGYFKQLKSLPDMFKPIVVCLHRHDVKQQMHKKMRQYDIPILTAGETTSQLFVDRFYSLVSSFEFATSTEYGSNLSYCYELGLKYFLFGEKPMYNNLGDKNAPLGKFETYSTDEHTIRTKKYIQGLFDWPNYERNNSKDRVINLLLGTGNQKSRIHVYIIILIEYIYNASYIIKKIVRKISKWMII